MDCPECNKEMRWVGDQTIDEYLEIVYDCSDCLLDVIKRKQLHSCQNTTN